MKVSKEVDEKEPIYIAHRQEETLDALKKGEIKDVRVSQSLPVDKIISFLSLGQTLLSKTGINSDLVKLEP